MKRRHKAARTSEEGPLTCPNAPWKQRNNLSVWNQKTNRGNTRSEKPNSLWSSQRETHNRSDPADSACTSEPICLTTPATRSSSREVRIRAPDLFSVVYFSRGTLPKKKKWKPPQKRNGDRALPGDLGKLLSRRRMGGDFLKASAALLQRRLPTARADGGAEGANSSETSLGNTNQKHETAILRNDGGNTTPRLQNALLVSSGSGRIDENYSKIAFFMLAVSLTPALTTKSKHEGFLVSLRSCFTTFLNRSLPGLTRLGRCAGMPTKVAGPSVGKANKQHKWAQGWPMATCQVNASC